MDIQVDPHLINQAYKQLLSEAQSELVLVQAAATQLQSQNQDLQRQLDELREEHQKLMQQTGRQDGMPQEETSPSSAS